MSLLFDTRSSTSEEESAHSEARNDGDYVLLLTVPHYCIISRNIDQGCDANVDIYAQQIHEQNPRHSEPPLLGTEERRRADENRRQGRNSKMRVALRAKLEDHSAYPRLLVLDVHSFPRRFDWESGRATQIVLLDDLVKGEWSREATLLEQELKSEEFSVKIVRAAKRNDIQQEARKNGRPAVLMEIMDETTSQEAARAGLAVRRWADRYFYSQPQ